MVEIVEGFYRLVLLFVNIGLVFIGFRGYFS